MFSPTNVRWSSCRCSRGNCRVELGTRFAGTSSPDWSAARAARSAGGWPARRRAMSPRQSVNEDLPTFSGSYSERSGLFYAEIKFMLFFRYCRIGGDRRGYLENRSL